MSDNRPAVIVERNGHLMIATINRPEVRNSINCDVHVGLGVAIEEAEHDSNIRVVIITGAGDQAFSAGADLKALSRGESLAPQNEITK